MEPEKWERITGEKIPDPYPENGLTVSSERMRFQTSKYIRRIMGTSVPPLRKWIMMFLNMATIRRLPSH